MKRLALLGHPVAHSLSPAMQRAALTEMELAGEWSYEAIDVEPAGFAGRLRELARGGYRGANVTIPHKREALALADSASRTASEIGAANTLSFAAGTVAAENTDAPGLLAALPTTAAGRRALVLGAGGAARAAVWALAGAGAHVWTWNRTADRAEALARELGTKALEGSDGKASLPLERFELLVNATPIGLRDPRRAGDDLKALRLDADSFGEDHVVVDLAYTRDGTELCASARAAGARVVDGREVLVHQGALSLRAWTGRRPPLEAMRRAVGLPADGTEGGS